MTSAFRLELGADGVAFLIFDLPNEKVNKLSLPILEELDNLLDVAKKNSSIKILVIKSSKPNMFIAGADLKSIEFALNNVNFAHKIIEFGHQVFCKLSDLQFPTIAVIDGVCLGGGLELALACTYRVASENEKIIIGFPEIELGLFPGWGGTQRLPKLIGLKQSLKMILTGKSINFREALKIKLVDAIYSEQNIHENLHAFINKCLDPKCVKLILKNRKSKNFREYLIENNPIGRRFLFYFAKKKIIKTKNLYPVITVTLNLIKKTFKRPLKKGLKIEQQTFINSIPKAFKNAKNLIRLFFATQEIKKNPEIYENTLQIRPIKFAGVVGANTLGAEIAWLLTFHDITVKLQDVNWSKIGKGCALIYSTYHKLLKSHKFKFFEVERKFQNLTLAIDYTCFKDADIVFEFTEDNFELKRKIYKELEEVVKETAILASNSYIISISELSRFMRFPNRLIGMHFSNFSPDMSLVEVVPGINTTSEIIGYAIEFCKKIKKNPIVVKDSPGLLLNRIVAIGINEGFWMIEEGVETEHLDKVITEFGMPNGPCQLSDEVGNDQMSEMLNFLCAAFGERMNPAPIIQKMIQLKLLGRKSEKGFYLYERERIKKNNEIKNVVNGIGKTIKLTRSITDSEIIDRYLLMMINEAARCLEENVVASPLHLDIALFYGIGFPSFRFGLLSYADTLGIKTIIDKLNHYTKVCGPRFAPCDYLLKRRFFYDTTSHSLHSVVCDLDNFSSHPNSEKN